MEPYYQKDGITIYHGDFLEVPRGHVGLCLTDPPYSRAGALHTGRTSTAGRARSTRDGDQFWLYWFRDVACRIAEWTMSHAYIFSDYRTIGLVEQAFGLTDWAVTQALVWDREGMGMGSPYRASHELIAFARAPKMKWVGAKNLRNVIRCRWPYGRTPYHPAEKPIDLCERLIADGEVGGAVLDPFVGSGTTLLAAKRLSLEAIGVELEEEYCEIAAKRLDAELRASNVDYRRRSVVTRPCKCEVAAERLSQGVLDLAGT